jgi:hypothetical protein
MKKIITAAILFLLPTLASAATLSVSPSTQSVNVGDTISISVNLDTQGSSIDGVDLRYLNYNPALLQVQDANTSTTGVQITAGSLMPMTLANSVDTSLGKITFSQVVAGGNKYKGSDTLATISFKALAAGTANLTFNYTLNSTTDSNVASSGSDVLSAVVNGVYTINTSGSTTGGSGSGGSKSSGGSGSSSGGTTSSTSGVSACTAGSAISLSSNLARGSKGTDVTNLQNFLISKGYLATGNNTGFFGSMTESALQSFQKAQGLVSSGSAATTGYGAAGPKTRAAINSLSGACATGTSTEALQAQIKVLQAMVSQLLLKLQSMQR